VSAILATVLLQSEGQPPLLILGTPPTSLLLNGNVQVRKLLLLKSLSFLTATELTRTATQSTVKLLTLIYG